MELKFKERKGGKKHRQMDFPAMVLNSKPIKSKKIRIWGRPTEQQKSVYRHRERKNSKRRFFAKATVEGRERGFRHKFADFMRVSLITRRGESSTFQAPFPFFHARYKNGYTMQIGKERDDGWIRYRPGNERDDGDDADK